MHKLLTTKEREEKDSRRTPRLEPRRGDIGFITQASGGGLGRARPREAAEASLYRALGGGCDDCLGAADPPLC